MATPPDLSGCSEYPLQNWEQQLTSYIGGACLLIAVTDIFLMRNRIYYMHGMRDRFTILLIVPGLYAMLQALTPWLGSQPKLTANSSAVKMLYADLQAILCSAYMYTSLTYDLSHFAMGNQGTDGYASTTEAIEKVGAILEEMDLPPLKLPFIAVPFWGKCYVKPGKDFLYGCKLRLHIYMFYAFVQLIVKQFVLDRLELNPPVNGNIWNYANIYFTMVFLCSILCAISARVPLDSVIKPFNMPLPKGQVTAGWRARQFLLIFPLCTGCNAIISLITTSLRPTCLWWVRHNNLFLVSILFIAVLIGHKAWLPPFVWGTGTNSLEPHEAQVWDSLFDLSSSSTGSREKMIDGSASAMFQRMALNPELGKKVYMGEMVMEDARGDFKRSTEATDNEQPESKGDEAVIALDVRTPKGSVGKGVKNPVLDEHLGEKYSPKSSDKK